MPFNSLPGLGDAAAHSIFETAKANPELSVEELKLKAGLSKSVVDILDRNGVFSSISETNQITLFGSSGGESRLQRSSAPPQEDAHKSKAAQKSVPAPDGTDNSIGISESDQITLF